MSIIMSNKKTEISHFIKKVRQGSTISHGNKTNVSRTIDKVLMKAFVSAVGFSTPHGINHFISDEIENIISFVKDQEVFYSTLYPDLNGLTFHEMPFLYQNYINDFQLHLSVIPPRIMKDNDFCELFGHNIEQGTLEKILELYKNDI